VQKPGEYRRKLCAVLKGEEQVSLDQQRPCYFIFKKKCTLSICYLPFFNHSSNFQIKFRNPFYYGKVFLKDFGGNELFCAKAVSHNKL